MQITQRLFSYSLRILSLRLHSLICPFGCVGSAESLFRFLFTHCLLAGMPVYLSLSHSHTPSRYYINIVYRELWLRGKTAEIRLRLLNQHCHCTKVNSNSLALSTASTSNFKWRFAVSNCIAVRWPANSSGFKLVLVVSRFCSTDILLTLNLRRVGNFTLKLVLFKHPHRHTHTILRVSV